MTSIMPQCYWEMATTKTYV